MPLGIVAFLVSVAYWPWMPSAIIYPRWTAAGVCLFAILLFTTVRPTLPHILGAAFLAWCALTSLWAPSGLDSAGALLHWGALAAAFCVAAETEDDQFRWVWVGLGLGAFANAAIGIFQVFGHQIFDIAGVSKNVATGLFGNKNFLANFGALAFLGCLFGLRLSKWTAPLVVASLLCLMMPASRGALMGTLMALMIIGWRFAGFGWRSFFVAGCIPVLGILVVDMFVVPGRFMSSAAPRLEILDWALSNLLLFGWGIGNHGTIFPFEHSNFDLLEIAFETGLPGVILAVAFVASLLVKSSRTAEWSVLVAFLFIGLVTFPLAQPAPAVIAAMVAGRLARDYHRVRFVERRRGVIRMAGVPVAWAVRSAAIRYARAVGRALPSRPKHPPGS